MIMHPSTTASHQSPSPSKIDVFEFDPSGTMSSSAAAPRHSSSYDDLDDEFPISTMPGRGEASPGNTALIGNGDQGSGTPPDSSTSYRIPSSVFQTKSSTQGDWSVASNESLFSIQTENASFKREQLGWIDRSSDEQMLLPNDTELLFSGPLLDFSGYPTSNNRPAAIENRSDEAEKFGIAGGSNVAGLSINVTAPKSGELPPIKIANPLNADEFNKETSLIKGVAHSPASSPVSDDGSCKSFAFPVLSRNDTSGLATPKQPVLPPVHSRKPTEPSSAKTNQQPRTEVQPAKKPAATVACCTWFTCFTGCGAAPRS